MIFLLLSLLLFDKISLLCVSFGKGMDYNRDKRLVFEIPKNTIDVLFAGDSHVFHSFIPQLIFDEKGYSSVVAATSNQSVINSYWVIKEVLVDQKPKVLVMDIHSVEDTLRKKDDFFHFTSGVLAIPDLSINKYLCYKDLKESNYGMSDSLTLSDVIGFFQFREDYERNDASFFELFSLLFHPAKEFDTFGYYPAPDVTQVDEFVVGSEKNESFTETISYAYLNRIFELCTENGINMILTRTPYSSKTGDIHSYEQIFEWARERNVEVIDYFDLIDEIGFDKDTDFFNNTHLNYNGAKKVTLHMVGVLNKYGLVDHRDDKRYSLWINNSFDYESVERQMKENIRNVDEKGKE